MTDLTETFCAGEKENRTAAAQLADFSMFLATYELTGHFVIVSCLGYIPGSAGPALLNDEESSSKTDIAYFASITPVSVIFSLPVILLLSVSISAVPVIRVYKPDTSAARRQMCCLRQQTDR